MKEFGAKINNGGRRFLSHRIHVPLPMLVLKIALLLGLAIVSTVFIVQTVVLKYKLEWQPPPMILVPGLTASKLYVESNGNVPYPNKPNYKNCDGRIPLRKSWISNHLSEKTDCELFLLSLDYDKGKFKNQPGVDVTANLRGVPFGSSLWPVQCIYTDHDPLFCDYATLEGKDDNYFRRLAEFLTGKLKYQPGKTLFAAQYDWRHHQESDVMQKYYADLKSLVEHTVFITKRKLLLLGHSMGNIVINRFLRQDNITAEWQKKHLEATINVAAPYGGAIGQIRALISGRPMELPENKTVSATQYVDFVRKLGFVANLLPFPNAFGQHEFLQIDNKAFTANQLNKLLKDLELEHLFELHAKNEPKPQEHIPMHCIYSVGANNTDRKLVYKSLKPPQQGSSDDPEETVLGDGDGTVNAESLRVCQQWKEQGHRVTVKEFNNFKHTEILMQREFYEYLAELIISF